MSVYNEERRCCTVCDDKQKCSACGNKAAQLACSDCRIDFGVTIRVCATRECRDAHESKCSARLREQLATREQPIESFRSRAVEAVRAKRDEWVELANKQTGWCQHVRAADEIATLLESLPAVEKEGA